MKKKTLISILIFCLILFVGVSATIAYFTDQKKVENTMTVGTVEIEQIEQMRDANGNLVAFEEQKLLPATKVRNTSEDTQVKINDVDYAFANVNNQKDKIVTVKNIGSEPVYVRTLFAFENKPASSNETGIFSKVHPVWSDDQSVDSTTVTIIIDGVEYIVLSFNYSEELEKDEITSPSLLQIYLDKSTTNDDIALLNGSYEIIVLSQAVQKAGFNDATSALNEAFGEFNQTNAQSWFNQ